MVVVCVCLYIELEDLVRMGVAWDWVLFLFV